MGRLIEDGCQLLVASKEEAPSIGDVVVFLSGQADHPITAHRIVAIRKRCGDDIIYATKGDCQPLWDQPISRAFIIGTVVAIVSNGSTRLRLDTRCAHMVGRLIAAASHWEARANARLRVRKDHMAAKSNIARVVRAALPLLVVSLHVLLICVCKLRGADEGHTRSSAQEKHG